VDWNNTEHFAVEQKIYDKLVQWDTSVTKQPKGHTH
jgi:hypothetical protein